MSKIYRQTGAGDAWNAGNIFSELMGFDNDERIFFSNIYAGLYISSIDPLHATLSDVINYIERI